MDTLVRKVFVVYTHNRADLEAEINEYCENFNVLDVKFSVQSPYNALSDPKYVALLTIA